ncbi:MAG: hypothetical protein H7177_13845 [Rhizobacter sp.]|nr:hypothetical protein [Bacteriovorax sp.]
MIIKFLLLIGFLTVVTHASEVNIDDEIIKNLEFYQNLDLMTDKDDFVKDLLVIEAPIVVTPESGAFEVERKK